MFSKKDISRYYDLSEVHYRLFWKLEKSKSLHYGYWDSSTKNFYEALLNINKILAQYVNISKEDVVLDAGCGVGGSSIWLAKNIGCKVTGISLNEQQVKQANAFAQKEAVEHLVSFQQNDYTNTGFADESYDIVWAIESVCYVPDKLEFIKESFRLLKAGGRLIVADFFKKDGLRGKDAAEVKRWANGWAIEDYATKEDFEYQLNETGFATFVLTTFALTTFVFVGAVAAIFFGAVLVAVVGDGIKPSAAACMGDIFDITFSLTINKNN